MFRAPRGKGEVDLPLLAVRFVLGLPVSRVHQHGLGDSAARLDRSLHHRLKMAVIRLKIGDTLRDDDLRLTVNHGLAVVVLEKRTAAFLN